jgi:hypothetical protein
MATKKPQFVIIRTRFAGVHAGELVERNGSEAVVANVRRIWGWQGANTLNEIALRGVGKGSRVSEPVAVNELTDVIECIHATDEARKNLEAAKWE